MARVKEPWHVARPALRNEIESALKAEQTDLYVVERDGVLFLNGAFVVRDANGELDRFAVRITFPDDYPDSLPVIEEVGGRIPRIADRHINPNGSACLLVPEEWLAAKDQSFRAFLRGPMHSFFVGQSLAEMGKPWPFGERPHGLAGVVESYEEILGVRGIDQVRSFLTMLVKECIKGHWPCPCASGLRLRKCHGHVLRELSERVTPPIAEKMLQRLAQ